MKKFIQGFLTGVAFFSAVFVIINFIMESRKKNGQISLNK